MVLAEGSCSKDFMVVFLEGFMVFIEKFHGFVLSSSFCQAMTIGCLFWFLPRKNLLIRKGMFDTWPCWSAAICVHLNSWIPSSAHPPSASCLSLHPPKQPLNLSSTNLHPPTPAHLSSTSLHQPPICQLPLSPPTPATTLSTLSTHLSKLVFVFCFFTISCIPLFSTYLGFPTHLGSQSGNLTMNSPPTPNLFNHRDNTFPSASCLSIHSSKTLGHSCECVYLIHSIQTQPKRYQGWNWREL